MRPRKETPLSVAERVRRYAEKKKGEDPESWLEKGRQKRKTFLEKMSKEEKDDFKRKDRERKRAKRQEEKLRKMKELSTPYKTSAALGKARARVAKALPSNPLRAQEVVDSLKRILDKTVGPKVGVVQEEEVPRALKLTPEVRIQITTFY